MEQSIDQLNGYLNALGKLCGQQGWRYGFYVLYSEIEDGVDNTLASIVESIRLPSEYNAVSDTCEFVHDTPCKFIGKHKIDYDESNKIMAEAIFSNIKFDINKEQTKPIFKEVLWHIHEYFGLASCSIDGPFNPTVSGPMWSLEIERPDKKEFSYLAVQIKEYLVFMGLEYE